MIPMPIRPPEPVAGPERTQLENWLDFHRATLLMKCAELTFEQLTLRAVAPSTLTLLGLLQHMTLVEVWWFDVVLLDSTTPLPYSSDDDRDAEFNDFTFATPEEVAASFLAAGVRSRELAAPLSLDATTARTGRDNVLDLRWIYNHMIVEYARHNGHADLLREVIDGTTGL
jgi:uncharacterized damage-inducible protein DinB